MDLVQDIDLFRRAVGAPKLSIYGMSYGVWPALCEMRD